MASESLGSPYFFAERSIVVYPHTSTFLGSFTLGLLFLFLLALRPVVTSGLNHPDPAASSSEAAARAQVGTAYGQLPLQFEANQGQFNGSSRFVARSHQLSLALTEEAAWLQ